MIIREEIAINAPLAVVWSVFSRMEQWQDWNTVCRECCYLDGDAMAVDTCFSFKIAPLFFPMSVEPRIIKCVPGQEVVWKGGRFGIHGEHTFRFSDENGRVRVLSIEEFKGPTLAFSRILGVPKRLHRLTEAFLHAIKQHAESCAAAV